MTPLVLHSALPGIVRISCQHLLQYVSHDDDRMLELCPSSAFLGDGHFASFFSVLLMINTMLVVFPLMVFFVASMVGCLRRQNCCRTIGNLARIDPTSPQLSECPMLDMSVREPFPKIRFHNNSGSIHLMFLDPYKCAGLGSIVARSALLWPKILSAHGYLCEAVRNDSCWTHDMALCILATDR